MSFLLACFAAGAFARQAETQESPFLPNADLAQAAVPNTSGPSLVAYCFECVGLISSTGNLYFTNFGINEFGPSSASFYRTGKYSLPGTERQIYSESGPAYFNFGNVVWAYVNGTYYGYFVANYDRGGGRLSEIKRVPLAGGPAADLYETSNYIGVGDLATDGSTLFWVEPDGVRSMSVNGNNLNTLVSSTAISHITLDATYVYYSEGAQINRVPKAGGSITNFYSAAASVTALYAWTYNFNYSDIIWGEKGGAVRSTDNHGTFQYTWQNPIPGRDVTSVGYNGARALWIDCSEPGNSQCNASIQSGGIHPVTIDAGVGASHLQWDATSMYWIGGPGIHRYVY
jgi:hypothetical protein